MPDDLPQYEMLTMPQMRDLWPQSEDGRLCARLLQNYGFSLLVSNSAANEGLLQAQAESGAAKAIALIIKDFGTLATGAPEKPKTSPLPKLNRYKDHENPPPF